MVHGSCHAVVSPPQFFGRELQQTQELDGSLLS